MDQKIKRITFTVSFILSGLLLMSLGYVMAQIEFIGVSGIFNIVNTIILIIMIVLPLWRISGEIYKNEEDVNESGN